MTNTFLPFQSSEIEAIFSDYPPPIQNRCLHIRQLIFDIANQYPEIGPLEETLRWGEPSYIPNKTKSGSMIRLHHYPLKPFDFSVFFLCQTQLVTTFKELYPSTFHFSGNRSLDFLVSEPMPWPELQHCIFMALSYHLTIPYTPL